MSSEANDLDGMPKLEAVLPEVENDDDLKQMPHLEPEVDEGKAKDHNGNHLYALLLQMIQNLAPVAQNTGKTVKKRSSGRQNSRRTSRKQIIKRQKSKIIDLEGMPKLAAVLSQSEEVENDMEMPHLEVEIYQNSRRASHKLIKRQKSEDIVLERMPKLEAVLPESENDDGLAEMPHLDAEVDMEKEPLKDHNNNDLFYKY